MNKPQKETCFSLTLMLANIIAFVLIATYEAIRRWIKNLCRKGSLR